MRLLDKLFCSGGFQFPVATTSCNKHCDLSVTNIRRVCTLIGVHLLSTWPVLRGSGNCLLDPPWMGVDRIRLERIRSIIATQCVVPDNLDYMVK